MTTAEINVQVQEIFRKVFRNEQIQITNSTSANDIEEWDSLTHMDLISTIESHFNIKFGLKDLARMNSVGILIEIIKSKLP